MKFFTPNIERSGRVARGLCGAVALAGAWISREEIWVAAALAFSGLLMLFEAVRGWCLARACGMKTPM